jgi:hypothetical protein
MASSRPSSAAVVPRAEACAGYSVFRVQFEIEDIKVYRAQGLKLCKHFRAG